MKCANCRRTSERNICNNCWNFAIDQLHKFPNYYYSLEKEMLPSQGYGERVQSSKTPPIPVRLETLHLRTGGISQPLMKHESRIRIIRKETKITFRGDEQNRITITCEYHINRSEWTYHNYDNIEELTKDIIETSNTINFVLGNKSEDIMIGSCPTVDEDGNRCNSKLKINPQMRTSVITCRVCDASWDSTKWRLLGKMLDA